VRSLADIVLEDDVLQKSEYMHMVLVAVPKIPDPEAMVMGLKGLNTQRSSKKWRSRLILRSRSREIACIAELLLSYALETPESRRYVSGLHPQTSSILATFANFFQPRFSELTRC
jgi:hypothetical protein